jgi:ribosome-binding protein aMBF1 (putative translation factor)
MYKPVRSRHGELTPEQRQRMREAYDIAERHGEDIVQEGREWLEAARQRLAFLCEARDRAGLSLDEVAERMDVDKSNLAKLEKAGNPTVDTLQRYAAALGQRLVITLEPINFPAVEDTTGEHRMGMLRMPGWA